MQKDINSGIIIQDIYLEKRNGMKKVAFKVNTNAEKAIIVTALSAILAIIFDQKKKKPEKRKNFIQRTKNHYKRVDKLITKTIGKDVAANEAKRRENEGIRSAKLRKMTIEPSIPFDLELEENKND